MKAQTWIFALWLLAAGAASGQFTLTQTDGSSSAGAPTGFDPEAGLTWVVGGASTTVPLGRVVALESTGGEIPPPAGSFRIELRSGDVLHGMIEGGSTDDVKIRGPGFGDATVSLDDVAWILNLDFPRPAVGNTTDQKDGETLYVDRNGHVDSIRGGLDRIGKNEVWFKFSGATGEKRRFEFGRDRVVAVRFGGAATTKADPAAATVRLRDGSRVTGRLKSGDSARVRVALVSGPEIAIDWTHVRTITFRGGSFRYLSDLEPAAFDETPLTVGTVKYGLRRDGRLHPGDGLRIGRQPFAKGLLAAARSTLRYALDGSFQRFSARVGADPSTESRELPGAVRITIAVDGKNRFTSAILRAGQEPVPVDFDGLGGAKELTITIDFADSFDAGARGVIANAMILK